MKVLVVGSTGILGSEICRRLTLSGQSVRGLVRSTSGSEKVERLQAMGVETVLGDLRDPPSLARAVQGADAVISSATTTISMQPGDSIPVTDQQGQLDLVAAAKAAGVRHFTLVSIPLDISPCPLATAKRAVENALIASGMDYTILRPCIFMEIWLSPALGFDYPHAKANILGDGHAQNMYISLGDVAQYAVESLSRPAACNAAFDLGHELHSPLEVVRKFEQAGGKPFELQFVPEAALAAQKAAATDPLQVSFAAMGHDMATGHIRNDPSAARRVFHFPLATLDDYVRRVMN